MSVPAFEAVSRVLQERCQTKQCSKLDAIKRCHGEKRLGGHVADLGECRICSATNIERTTSIEDTKAPASVGRRVTVQRVAVQPRKGRRTSVRAKAGGHANRKDRRRIAERHSALCTRSDPQ